MTIPRITLGLLLLAGTAAAEMKVFPNKQADFSQYKTYEWLPPRLMNRRGITDNDERFTPVIKRLVDAQMAAKGFQRVEKGGDMQIITAAVSESTPQLEAIMVFFNYATDWGYPSGYATMSRVNREGTLALGFIDTRTQKGLWVGMYTAGLGKPGTEEKTVDKAVRKLFNKFPPSK